jgi:hypothetical protein
MADRSNVRESGRSLDHDQAEAVFVRTNFSSSVSSLRTNMWVVMELDESSTKSLLWFFVLKP